MAIRLSFFLSSLLVGFTKVHGLETLSIGDQVEGHYCVSQCLSYYIPRSALGCANPIDNTCYCVTDVKSVSAAASGVSSCASSLCSAGDVKQDLSSMKSAYASYCLSNDFKQEGLDGWYTPAKETKETEKPSETTAAESAQVTKESKVPEKTTNPPGDAPTSTRLTVVTQTTESGAGASRSQVIVEVTSTLLVRPDGSRVDSDKSSSSSNAVKIGVGVAVPVVVLVAGGIGLWLWLRRRANNKRPNNEGPPPTYQPPEGDFQQQSMSQASMSRKPMPSPAVSPVSQSVTPEMPGNVHQHHEVGGQQVSPPAVSPANQSAYTPPPQQQYEMSGDGRRPELYSGVHNAQQGGYQGGQPTQRWELPGSQ